MNWEVGCELGSGMSELGSGMLNWEVGGLEVNSEVG